MHFFTIQEFKNKYNQDVALWQIEMACEMIYNQVGLKYRDPSWTEDTCPTPIKNASMEQLRFILEYDKKQKTLNIKNDEIKTIMAELQSLSDGIEKQTEEEKIAEFEAYENALEEVEKEKDKYEQEIISLKNELYVYKNALKERMS